VAVSGFSVGLIYMYGFVGYMDSTQNNTSNS
jgi:hypothetical protein